MLLHLPLPPAPAALHPPDLSSLVPAFVLSFALALLFPLVSLGAALVYSPLLWCTSATALALPLPQPKPSPLLWRPVPPQFQTANLPQALSTPLPLPMLPG